jgi:hypothetical protein
VSKPTPQKDTPPGKGLRYKPEEIIAVFRTNHGNVSATARVLGCDRGTVLDYCTRFPEVQAAKEEGVEDRIDLAEEKLQEAINDRESWAIQLALRGQGAKRGHGERTVTDVTSDGKPIRFTFALDNANASSKDS